MKKADLATPIDLYYAGPELRQDFLPCVFYFALSAEESLSTPPFCSPVNFLLQNRSIRVFSVDLPFHGSGHSSIDAMPKWIDHVDQVEEFLSNLSLSLKMLFSYLLPSKVAVMGLSRGALIAGKIAAQHSLISHMVLFAPLLSLQNLKEGFDLPLSKNISLESEVSALASKKTQIYIGNRDTRVSTDACYQWTRALIEEAYAKKIRSLQIELFLQPSIGYLGHGTSEKSFQNGANWLSHEL